MPGSLHHCEQKNLNLLSCTIYYDGYKKLTIKILHSLKKLRIFRRYKNFFQQKRDTKQTRRIEAKNKASYIGHKSDLETLHAYKSKPFLENVTSGLNGKKALHNILRSR